MSIFMNKNVFPFEADRIRYYSLARHALLSALQISGVSKGYRVLLPSFICRDLLAPIAIVGATPVWYEVDERLLPCEQSEVWPEAEFVLMVNYFGFPQDLQPFLKYVARTNAILIEDNAHGFLSRDDDGNFLGSRGNYSIFSIRKTLRIPDGAALVVNDLKKTSNIQNQLPFNGVGLHSAQTIKRLLRRLPIVGKYILNIFNYLIRQIRKLKTGSKFPLPNPNSEFEITESANPWKGLLDSLGDCNVNSEILRRRARYFECESLAKAAGIEPIFPFLPTNCVPYGFPFHSDLVNMKVMQDYADAHGFDLVRWPDLPDAISKDAPLHYRKVSLVNFLW